MSRGRFSRLGDLPPDHGQQLPGRGSPNVPYPGSAHTPNPYGPRPGVTAGAGPSQSAPLNQQTGAAQAQSAPPVTTMPGAPKGTAHPLYQAGNYISIDYFGTGTSILVSPAKNRVYLGIQNNGAAGNIFVGFGTNAGNGSGLTIVPNFLWDNTIKPPGGNIYVWAPVGVRFTIIEAL